MSRALLLATAFTAVVFPALASAQASPSAFTWATRYDAMHRVVGTIAPDPDGSGPLGYAAVRNTYDENGRLTRVEKGELSGWQSENVDPSAWSGFTVSSQVDTSYDPDGRKLVETVSAGGTVVSRHQWSWDGLDRVVCDTVRMNSAGGFANAPADACQLGSGGAEADRITHMTYGSDERVAKVQKAYGTSLQQDYQTYTWFDTGKPGSVTDADGWMTSYGYDTLERQSGVYFPSPTSTNTSSTTDYEAYGYDLNGNRTSLRKRDGRVLTYSYDALNRPIVKQVPTACVSGYACTNPPASAVRSVYYSYDLRGLQLAARFDSASGSDAVLSSYDGLGRLASSTTSMAGMSRILAYQYDADGNRTQLTHPDGVSFSSSYDGLDRLNGASWTTGAGTTSFLSLTYNSLGARASETQGGSTTSWNYDGVVRPTSAAHGFASGSGNMTEGLGYNAASQIVTRTRDSNDYAYTGDVSLTRSYTVNGLNQYLTAGPASFGYDANGNLTSDGTNSFAYDVENRLVVMNSTALTYDPNGRLWQVQTASTTTRFLYDGDELAAEYDAAGNLTRRFMFAGEDEPVLEDAGGALNCTGTRFLHADHQGSIVASSDCSAVRQTVSAYDEWGIRGPNNAGRFQYTGQAWLPELGLYYYKARMYSPFLGRFMQTDPIGYKDQMDLYAYVANDPVNGRDPTGTYQCTKGAEAACDRIDRSVKEIKRIRSSSQIYEYKLRTDLNQSLNTIGSRNDGGTPVTMISERECPEACSARPGERQSINFDPAVVKNGPFIRFVGTVAHEFGHVYDHMNHIGRWSVQDTYNSERQRTLLGIVVRQSLGDRPYGADALQTPVETAREHAYSVACGNYHPPSACPVQAW